MTTAEKNTQIKVMALAKLGIPEDAVQVNDFGFAIPVEIEGVTRYATFDLTARNDKSTKTSEGFTVERAVNAWHAEQQRKANNAAERAAKKAAKMAKVQSAKEDK